MQQHHPLSLIQLHPLNLSFASTSVHSTPCLSKTLKRPFCFYPLVLLTGEMRAVVKNRVSLAMPNSLKQVKWSEEATSMISISM